VSGGDISGAVSSYRWWVDNVLQSRGGASRSLLGLSHVAVTVGDVPALTNAATVPLSFTTDADVMRSPAPCGRLGSCP
jgi:hypothetical protein